MKREFFGALLFSAVVGAQAQGVIVFSMAGDSVADPTYKHVLRFSGRAGDFRDPVSALDSITDADVDNRYLVVLGPGIYPLSPGSQLVMKEHVDIAGAGQNLTTITGNNSDSNDVVLACGTVVGADLATLSDLTVVNDGGGGPDIGCGIVNVDASPKLLNITAKAIDHVNPHGIVNLSGSDPTLVHVRAEVSGGTYGTGIRSDDSSPTMHHVTAIASGESAWGIVGLHSSAHMENIVAIARGGSNGSTHGIRLSGSNTVSMPVLINASASAESASSYSAYGIEISSKAQAYLNQVRASAPGGAGSSNYGVYIQRFAASRRAPRSATKLSIVRLGQYPAD